MAEDLRYLLVDVAMINPRLAGAVKHLREELVDGEPLPPELLLSLGEHVREIGEAMVGRAEYLGLAQV